VSTHFSQRNGGPPAKVEGINVWQPRLLPGAILYRGSRVTHRYPRHWHDELHVCLYSAGSGYLTLKGCSYSSAPGTFAITPAGEVHENWVTPGASVSFRSIYIPSTLLRSALEELEGSSNEPAFQEVLPEAADVASRFLAMHCAIESGESHLHCEELWLEFVTALVEQCSDCGNLPSRAGREKQSVSRAREYIESHFAEPVSLAELSRITGLSPFHLHRVFSGETGMPPHAYQTQLRINHAKRLLRKGHRLTDVALSTGFADQSHLTRHFKRLVGTTPSRFACE
jgi:AraC-like DNA-binding protein